VSSRSGQTRRYAFLRGQKNLLKSCPDGRTLEFMAFDMEGRLFDYLTIDKRAAEATSVLQADANP
jgi:hypothetical protein